MDLKDIFPENTLPSFNSNAIESRIPFIPNLSEHFLYLNDDCFFGQCLEPSYFFDDNNNPIVNVKKVHFTEENISIHYYRRYLYNMNQLVNENFKTDFSFWDCHSITAYRKSYMIDNILNSFLKEDFDNMLNNKFRHIDDIQRFVHNLLDNAKNRNTLRIFSKHNFLDNVKNRNTLRMFSRYREFMNFFQKIGKCFFKNRNTDILTVESEVDVICKYKPKLFCINGLGSLDAESLKYVKKFFETSFPNKSQFEK